MKHEEYNFIKDNYNQIRINIDNGHSLCGGIIITCNKCIFNPNVKHKPCGKAFLRALSEFEETHPELTL